MRSATAPAKRGPDRNIRSGSTSPRAAMPSLANVPASSINAGVSTHDQPIQLPDPSVRTPELACQSRTAIRENASFTRLPQVGRTLRSADLVLRSVSLSRRCSRTVPKLRSSRGSLNLLEQSISLTTPSVCGHSSRWWRSLAFLIVRGWDNQVRVTPAARPSQPGARVRSPRHRSCVRSVPRC